MPGEKNDTTQRDVTNVNICDLRKQDMDYRFGSNSPKSKDLQLTKQFVRYSSLIVLFPEAQVYCVTFKEAKAKKMLTKILFVKV